MSSGIWIAIVGAYADACAPNMRVVLVDDVIATGGTAIAEIELLRGREAHIQLAMFVVDLIDFGGAQRMREHGVETRSLAAFAGS